MSKLLLILKYQLVNQKPNHYFFDYPKKTHFSLSKVPVLVRKLYKLGKLKRKKSRLIKLLYKLFAPVYQKFVYLTSYCNKLEF